MSDADMVTVSNDVRSAFQKCDFDSNYVLSAAEAAACLGNLHVNVSDAAAYANAILWRRPLPPPAASDSEDCELVTSGFYTLTIEENTNKIDDASDFSLAAWGVSLSVGHADPLSVCVAYEDGLITAIIPSYQGLRKIRLVIPRSSVKDDALAISLTTAEGDVRKWTGTIACDDDVPCSYFADTARTQTFDDASPISARPPGVNCGLLVVCRTGEVPRGALVEGLARSDAPREARGRPRRSPTWSRTPCSRSE